MANSTDKSILTAAGKALLAQLNAEEKALVIDKMIFANVPNRPEYPQPDDVVPTDHIVHQEQVEQRGRLSADTVIYTTTLTSDVGPFDFNWTGAYCSEYGVLVTIDHHALTPKTEDEPGVTGNTLVRSVVLEYKDIAEITNITVDASSWQYNATKRMKKMDSDVAQSIIDQNGKDWFIEDGFLVTPSGSAYNIKAGAGYVSGNRVAMEFDRSVQVPNKPSFIYIDAHREGTPTGEQVTLFNFVVTTEEKDDYIDSSTGKDIPHYVCKIAQVHADGSVSDARKKSASVKAEVGRKNQVLRCSGEKEDSAVWDYQWKEQKTDVLKFVQAGKSIQPIYILGDSISEGSNSTDWAYNNYASIIRRGIQQHYENRNFGFANFDFAVFDNPKIDPKVFPHKVSRHGFDEVYSFNSQYFGAVAIQSIKANDYIEVSYRGKDACVMYGQNVNGGILDVYLDGSLVGSIDTSDVGIDFRGSTEYGRMSVPIVAELWGDHIIRLVNRESKSVVLLGMSYFEDFNLTRNEPTVFNLGRSSLTLTEIPEIILDAYAQSGTMILSLGVNDSLLKKPLVEFKSKLEYVFDKFKYYKGQIIVADFIFNETYENNPYKKILRESCGDNSVPLIDFSDKWFSNVDDNKYADLLDSDGVHPTNKGHHFIGRSLINMMTIPFPKNGKDYLEGYKLNCSISNKWGNISDYHEEVSATVNGNLVVVQGGVKNVSGEVLGHGEKVLELPFDCRPEKRIQFSIPSQSGSIRVEITDEGEVEIVNSQVEQDNYISLSGISYIKMDSL